MKPLDLAALWREMLADARALMPLALPIAAAFVLLPNVAIDLFGPPLPAALRPGAHLAPGVLPAIPTDFVLIALVLPTLLGLVAQLAIVRLALDRRRGVARSVGEALAAALRVWPVAVLATLAGAVVLVPGLLLLIVPGLYVAGRLAVTLPLVAEGAGPLAALERSWALTAGNGWRAIAFTLLVAGWFVVVGFVGGIVAAGLAALFRGGVGAVAASTLDGLVAAVFAVVNAAAVTTLYRATVR